METLNARALTAQLADDLGWLEQHCRRQPAQARAAGQLRLAAALVRNCVGPLLDHQTPVPLHLAVVGGAGAGKSTVANLLSGAQEAEANPQAGFTRHPIAYTSTGGPSDWAGHLGFLGPLHRLNEPAPSSLDEDVYQVRRVPPEPKSYDLLKDFVVWDCPDMTTWAAAGAPVPPPAPGSRAVRRPPVPDANGAPSPEPRGGYVTRLLEVAALADVIVYVASDERYNDEVPTQFLSLLLQTGKPVVACMMKMREADREALVDHFRREVLARLPGHAVAVLAIPHLTHEQLADPARLAPRYRIELINQVAVLGSPAAAARRRSAQGAMRFLVQRQEQFLAVAREDVAALQGWQGVVEQGRAEFDERYRREYLTGEKFRGFDEALVRLMQLLELPGVGKLVSGTLYVLRTPYRLLRGWVGKALSRPEVAGRPELPVLEDALGGWLDLLRKEAARRADTHPLWSHVAQGFQTGGLAEQARERFQQHFRGFQVGLADEVDRTARSIYEELEKNPAKLATLRGGKFALDVAAIAAAVATGGVAHPWADVILVPLFASITHQLVELLGMSFVDAQREQTRQRQRTLLSEHLSGPLSAFLTQWPATGGSEFERLQLALQHVPPAVRQLDALVQAATADGGRP
jgi:hypothetical protein